MNHDTGIYRGIAITDNELYRGYPGSMPRIAPMIPQRCTKNDVPKMYRRCTVSCVLVKWNLREVAHRLPTGSPFFSVWKRSKWETDRPTPHTPAHRTPTSQHARPPLCWNRLDFPKGSQSPAPTLRIKIVITLQIYNYFRS